MGLRVRFVQCFYRRVCVFKGCWFYGGGGICAAILLSIFGWGGEADVSNVVRYITVSNMIKLK